MRGNFLSLAALRLRFRAIEIFKSVNDQNPSYLNKLFEGKDTGYNLRDGKRVKQNKFETVTFGYKSFKYYGSRLWNSLPVEIKSAESLYVFKKKITLWCRSAKAEEFIIM